VGCLFLTTTEPSTASSGVWSRQDEEKDLQEEAIRRQEAQFRG
jgi:hypothetical protein